MKNRKKVIIANIIFFSFLLVLLNLFIEDLLVNNKLILNIQEKIQTKKMVSKNNVFIDYREYITEPVTVKKLDFNSESYLKFCGEERIEFGLNKNYIKSPIILLGCSYAYGHGLAKEQTFSEHLSKLTERPVYNFSKCGQDIIHNYKNFEEYIQFSEERQNKIKSAEYIIYVYMNDHMHRYLAIVNHHIYRKYKQLFLGDCTSFKKKLEKIIAYFPLGRYILSLIRQQLILKDYPDNPFVEKASGLLKAIILNTKKEINQYAPNAKMIVVIWDEKHPDWYLNDYIKYTYGIMNSKIWEELKNEGIETVRTKDITGFVFDKEYKLKEDIADWHPNAKAWEVFTPPFVKKYIE